MDARVTGTLLWALAVSIMLPNMSWAETQNRVAVLQLRNTAALKMQEVGYLTDLVRGAALEVLPQAKYLVMTSVSIRALLPPGTDLEACIGECEVETGRNLGAGYIVTGDILRFGRSLRVRLSLYETKTAQLVAQSIASAKTLEALEGPIAAKSKEMFARLGGSSQGSVGRQNVALPSLSFDDLPEATGEPTVAMLDLGDLTRARAKRERSEREETARRAEAARNTEALRQAETAAKRRAQSKYNVQVEESWLKTKAHTSTGGARAVLVVDRFLETYKDGPFENPRAADAGALKARLQAEIQEARQATHDAKLHAQWAQVEIFVKAGGPEAQIALGRFLKLYRNHELGNPRAEDAERLLSVMRCGGRDRYGVGNPRTGTCRQAVGAD